MAAAEDDATVIGLRILQNFERDMRLDPAAYSASDLSKVLDSVTRLIEASANAQSSSGLSDLQLLMMGGRDAAKARADRAVEGANNADADASGKGNRKATRKKSK